MSRHGFGEIFLDDRTFFGNPVPGGASVTVEPEMTYRIVAIYGD